jgi:electron-transferring-flavoprotein dehydrogenase
MTSSRAKGGVAPRRSAAISAVRNAKPLWSKLGTMMGIGAGGIDMWTNTLGFSLLGTLGHGKPDAECLEPAAKFRPRHPKPDNSSPSTGSPRCSCRTPITRGRRCTCDDGSGPAEIVRARLCRPSGLLPTGVYEWVEEGARAS